MIEGASLPHADRRAADAIERGFIMLYALAGSLACAAMLLAWTGRLERGWLVPLFAVLSLSCAALLARSWRRDPRARPTPILDLALTIGLAMLAGALFFHPAQYAAAGGDGSVYTATAALLDRGGSLVPVDPLVESLAGEDRASLFPGSPSGQRFPGGFDLDLDTGRVRPQFLHLYPALGAAVGMLLGPSLRWYVNPVLALGAVLALWLLGRRLFGRVAGATAAALLAVSFVQIWFARFPSSEMLAQFLILSGLALSVLSMDTGSVPAAVGAGTAWGLLTFARIDALLSVAPIALWLAAGSGRDGRGRARRWIGGTLAGFACAGVGYTSTVAGPYAARIVGTVAAYADRHPVRALAALAVAVLLSAGLAIRGRWRLPRPVVIVTTSAVGVLLVAWLVWRDVLRGHFLDAVSPWGFAAGVLGLVAAAAGPERRRALPVGLVLLAGAVYLGAPFDRDIVPWMLRRYVPVLLPIAWLGVGALTETLATRRRGWLPALGVPLALGGWLVWSAWPIAARPLMRTGMADVQALAASLPPRALLVWDAATPPHLALAVQYEGNREGLVAPRGGDADAALRRLVTTVRAGGRPVRLVVDPRQATTDGAAWPVRLDGFRFAPEPPLSFGVELPATSGGRVTGSYRVDRRLDVYAIDAASAAVPAAVPFRIDVGERDVPFLLDGFHSIEVQGDATARWTNGEAHVRIPPLDLPRDRVARLSLRLAAGHPAGEAVVLDLFWNDEPLGRVPLAANWAVCELPLAGAVLSGGGELRLRSPTFVPAASGGGADTRRLGVLVDWIAIE